MDGPSGGTAGANTGGAGNAGTGSAEGCPDASSQPAEGAECPSPGLSCAGYGTLSCPLTAVCSAASTWQINCRSTMAFGPCACPQHDFGHVPSEHRATPVSCSHVRAPSLTLPSSTCSGSGGSVCPNDECNQDSDCADGAQGESGRCVPRGRSPVGLTCSYDKCFDDSDCANNAVCLCRDPSDGVGANYCAPPGTCRVDSDCSENDYCSPSQAHEWCGPFYACHTPNDECVNDEDCGTNTHCDFDVNSMHWVCGNLCGPSPPQLRSGEWRQRARAR